MQRRKLFSVLMLLALLVLLLPAGAAAQAPAPPAADDVGAGEPVFTPLPAGMAEGLAAQPEELLVCPPPGIINGTLSSATSPTQLGRIFRDGIASQCVPPKAFPGVFNPATTYRYEQFGPYDNPGVSSCVTVNFNTGTCGTLAHAVAYLNAYNPANQALNYLGDVGSSLSQPFSFQVPANQTFLVVVQQTAAGAINCNFSFQITGVTCAALAVNDTATSYGYHVFIDVLANDVPGPYPPITVNSVTQGAHGKVLNYVTKVVYIPDRGYHGSDSFTYTVKDANGNVSAPATVNVTVY